MDSTTNLGLRLPAGNEYADVADLNYNFEKIDAAMAAARSAEEYNPAGAYAVGDYCTKDGKLYKCTTAITAGEAWNAAHWAETSVGAELETMLAASYPRVGDIVSSQREDVLDKVGDVYLPCDGQIIAASEYPLLKDAVGTTIAGQVWSYVNHANIMTYAKFICQLSSGTLLLGRVGGIYRSADLGVTWVKTALDTNDYPVCMVQLSNGRVLVGLGFTSTSIGIYYSDNDGSTWTEMTTAPQYRVEGLGILSSGLIVAATNGGFYCSSNNGVTWSVLNSSTDFEKILVLPSNRIITRTGGAICYSDDNGATWTQSGGSSAGYTIQAIARDKNTGRIYISGGWVYRSDDNGETWIKGTKNISAGVLTVTDSGTVFIGKYYSITGGITWESVNYDPISAATASVDAATFLSDGSIVCVSTYTSYVYVNISVPDPSTITLPYLNRTYIKAKEVS